ncbi:hypothetical protein [Candidatus Nardonella dryophthoridicola]|uniref:DNA-directed RNA polymerase n=1 Tax=endosymbiont of Metamasius hemipterus TaxID=204627 RepID=A0ABT0TWR6_9GAMM|nr:hypothetical protein [Candidatus Nardonella dryophthoridicola]MCM0158235.1 hypothetical protein [endosymbiont of Metamasius hemipterus]
MKLGFHYSTIAGLSISVNDLKIPKNKNNIIKKTELYINKINNNYKNGIITLEEKYNKIINK